MANQPQLNNFVKQVILAAKKQEERKSESLEFHRPKSIHSKQIKSRLRDELNELESKLNKVSKTEEYLVKSDQEEHKQSEETKDRIKEIEQHIYQLGLQEYNTIDMMRTRIMELEHQLRLAEMKRSEEIHLNRAKIEEIRTVISNLKEKVGKAMEIKIERAEKIQNLEERFKIESKENKEEIDHIEEQLARLRSAEKKRKVGFFEKIRSMFHKKPKIDKIVKPETRKLFAEYPKEDLPMPEEKPSLPLPKLPPRPIINKRPVVRHDLLFEETSDKAKKSIPMSEERPDLPPPPKPPVIQRKKGFFEKVNDFLNKKI